MNTAGRELLDGLSYTEIAVAVNASDFPDDHRRYGNDAAIGYAVQGIEHLGLDGVRERAKEAERIGSIFEQLWQRYGAIPLADFRAQQRAAGREHRALWGTTARRDRCTVIGLRLAGT